MHFDLKDGEDIMTDIAANLILGIESVGGRMMVTSRRVVFQPGAVNIQRLQREIPMGQILSVTPHNFLGVIPNGVKIRLKSGVEYRFVVWGRNRIIDLIRSLSAR